MINCLRGFICWIVSSRKIVDTKFFKMGSDPQFLHKGVLNIHFYVPKSGGWMCSVLEITALPRVTSTIKILARS